MNEGDLVEAYDLTEAFNGDLTATYILRSWDVLIYIGQDEPYYAIVGSWAKVLSKYGPILVERSMLARRS